MSDLIKTKEEMNILKEGGKKLAWIIDELTSYIKPGVSTLELDERAHELFDSVEGTPAFYKHQPPGMKRPFPGAICVSVNDEVVHGIPNEDPYAFKEGDIVGIDAGLKYKELFTDMAVTTGVGDVDSKAHSLMNATKEALSAGVSAVSPDVSVVDIGRAIEKSVNIKKYGLVTTLGGHGVGKAVHEDPFVPNYDDEKFDFTLEEGMVLAIEPMLTEGGGDIYLDKDNWTFRTKDGSRSAHFEHTVAVTSEGPLILTDR